MRRKDKEQEQATKRKARSTKGGAANPRRQQALLIRAGETMTVRKKLLIVCEGRNTEPSYFKQFKLASATIEALGNGFNTVTLVREIIKLKEKAGYDQYWAVFDKDSFPNSDFNDAIELAKKNDIGVAYSNQSFEYWIILHFDDHQGGGMHRQLYDENINKHLKPFKAKYDGTGSKEITQEIFEVLMSLDEKTKKRRVELALKRAERNYDLYDHSNCSEEESSTTVFKLVKEILSYE